MQPIPLVDMFYLEMTASLQYSLRDHLEEWLYTVKKNFMPGWTLSKNIKGVEITVIKVTMIPHINIIVVYWSPKSQSDNCVQNRFKF